MPLDFEMDRSACGFAAITPLQSKYSLSGLNAPCDSHLVMVQACGPFPA